MEVLGRLQKKSLMGLETSLSSCRAGEWLGCGSLDLCRYTGRLYCHDCHHNALHLIPALALVVLETSLSSCRAGCRYTGRLYCHDCHHNALHLIPALVLQRWDFRARPGASTAASQAAAPAHCPVPGSSPGGRWGGGSQGGTPNTGSSQCDLDQCDMIVDG
ncbi:putative zinc-RING and/or ribbon [Haematococcus lacustris]|uniref:Putative zinc-RING and/or ribbon n=1 Tax=Haematococcus lacustris TaxID=44745 RepID=A0A699YI02_HAELA|nr:putative zinc-RING and/or ribbon [Haematococcus lacustris]